MAASTGPILAVGAITMANRYVFHEQPWDWKIPIATALSVVAFSGLELAVGPELPRGIALVALITVVLTRVDSTVPSPAETVLAWWNTK